MVAGYDRRYVASLGESVRDDLERLHTDCVGWVYVHDPALYGSVMARAQTSNYLRE